MLEKLISCFIGIGIAISAFAQSTPSTTDTAVKRHLSGKQLKTIIIDPGHGLPDPGTQGRYSNESDIALNIALKLEQKIKDSLPGVHILLTRRDRNLPNGLTSINAANRWRAQFANENGGDLFISIHVNDGGTISHSEVKDYTTQVYYTGKGRKRKRHTREIPVYRHWTTPSTVAATETYIWAVGKNDSKTSFVHNQDKEEMSGEKEDSSNNFYDSPEAKALASIRTRKYFEKSLMLATFVEDAFVKQGRISRGVKQRDNTGIWVLQATAMPSILVETGFIGAEEDYLNSEKGVEEVSSAVATAVKRYAAYVNKNINSLNQAQIKPRTEETESPQSDTSRPRRIESGISGQREIQN